MLNPLDQLTGSDRLRSPGNLLLLVSLLSLAAFMVSQMGLKIGIGFILLPFIFAYLYFIFSYPVIGLYTAIVFGFTILGLALYIDFQVGLLMDGILILTIIALIFNKFYEKID